MNTKKKLFMAAMAALVVSVAGPSLAKAAEPVRLGFSIAKTGIFAAAAPSQLHSYEMWKDEVNAAGGLDIAGEGKRPVEFVVYDDQSNPGQAARIYEKLITQDKVDLLLAPWGTSIHAAIAPVLERFKFPMVGNSAASAKLRDLKPGYIWFVTAAFPDREAKALADMLKSQNYETVALLANVLPYSKEFKKFLEPELEKQGIKAEVIDLRSLVPLDIDTIVASIQKTNRAIVVQEAQKTSGVAAEVIAQINEKAILHLEAPVLRVAGPDTVYPFAQIEDVWLPTPARIVAAAQKVLNF